MKKYLMTGVAAVAICAAFTSCSKTENLYDPDAVREMEVANVYEQYNRAFIATFGEVNPNQDWGFGKNAGTRGSYPNGNMWESEGWRVPPVLTDGQKERVYKYFQCHTPIGYQSPGWTNYWVQQVYKGGTDANNSYSKTKEEYASANGGWVLGSNHMDHLAAVGDGKFDHIFNFNNGNCTDWGGRMLMVGSTTASFGYYNSDGSLGHTEYTGLVSWTVIEEWGNANGVGSSLNDGWNRSFMGFDFEQIVGDDVYDGYAKYTGPAFDGYIWDGTKVIKVAEYDNNWQLQYLPGYENMKYNNKDVHYLTSNTNQYCGVAINYTSDDDVMIQKDGHKCLNMEKLNGLLAQGYLPVAGSNMKSWVKVQGGADGYYSDWIVTLCEAKGNIPDGYDVRIMAEDLNATAADGDTEDSDWDFNDVVFDVKFDQSGDGADIRLMAAGGVLKLTVAGEEVHAKFGYPNPDKDGRYPMINTGAGPKVDPVVFHIESGADKTNLGRGIPIVVYKKLSNGNEEPFVLEAKQGQPAAKFAVKSDVQYLGERVHINFASGGAFARAVNGGTDNFLWW